MFVCELKSKNNPTDWWGIILAERIGLEPMDRKIRSQISNLLHYHSANAPWCALAIIENHKINCKL